MSMEQHCSQTSPTDEVDRRTEELLLRRKMRDIGLKLLVLSGKGGVGKSTIAANLAFALAAAGKQVGLLDVDVHGPSIPRLTGLEGQRVTVDADGIRPLTVAENLKVMSVAFLLDDESQAVIWRGPIKHSVIRQLLADTNWGELDYLIIDAPPGTGDEPLSVAKLVGENASAVLVTTPQQIAIDDVRRCITFCKKVSLPIAGIIENMAGLLCPHCNKRIDLFGADGGRKLADDAGLPLLGSIPLDPAIVTGSDRGLALADSETGETTRRVFSGIVQTLLKNEGCEKKTIQQQEKNKMKIAIPLASGKLCMHFGHCEQFALLDIDVGSKTITHKQLLTPPPHEPGLLPRWLGEQGATRIIAGGMGQRARQLFLQQGIEVTVGAPAEEPEILAQAYLEGTLDTGENLCDH